MLCDYAMFAYVYARVANTTTCVPSLTHGLQRCSMTTNLHNANMNIMQLRDHALTRLSVLKVIGRPDDTQSCIADAGYILTACCCTTPTPR